jgi:peroxiredoxin
MASSSLSAPRLLGRALAVLTLGALVLGVPSLRAPAEANAGDMKAAADFTLRDTDGKSQSLSAFKGKVVLVNFWATWCGPCQVEMPHLQAMYTELGAKGFQVLGISVDDARSASMVKPKVKQLGLSYPVLQDLQSAVIAQYNPSKSLPYNVLVDRSGNIAKVYAGYNPGDEVTVRKDVEALLAQPAP